jgi:hypothetical protein
VLRGVEAQVVPLEQSAEPLGSLVTRVLYRIRHLSEQTPFDAGTFAYASPLISRIITQGGIGMEKSDTEAVLEQLALAVDVISFHSRKCEPLLLLFQDTVEINRSRRFRRRNCLSSTFDDYRSDCCSHDLSYAKPYCNSCFVGNVRSHEVVRNGSRNGSFVVRHDGGRGSCSFRLSSSYSSESLSAQCGWCMTSNVVRLL